MLRLEDGLEEEEEYVPEVDEFGNPIDKEEEFKKSDEFFELKDQVRKLQPMRIGIFKRYWDKFKFNKSRRDHLVEMFDETDKQIEFYLEDEFVSWRD